MTNHKDDDYFRSHPSSQPPSRKGRSQDGKESEAEGKWSKVPTWITAIAALITALTGFFAGRATAPAPDPSPPTATAVSPDSGIASATAGVSPTDATQSKEQTQIWGPQQFLVSGPVNFNHLPPINNDNARAGQTASNEPTDLYPYGDPSGTVTAGPGGSSRVSVWTGNSLPSEQECRLQAQTQAAQTVPIQKGEILCIIASWGNIVRLQVTTVNPSTIDTPTFETTATIWSPQ